MAIRWRLTFWFTLILGIILVLSTIFTHTLLKNHLQNEVDDDLKVYSARVHGTLHPDEIPDPVDYEVIHSSLPPINEFASPGIYIQLLDKDGNVVVKSDNLGEQELPVDTALIEHGFAGEAKIATVSAYQGADVRIMVSPLFLNDETLLLEVGKTLDHIDSTMSQLRWVMGIGILVSLVLAGISGAILARRALAPVGRITGIASEIEASSDLSRRVDYNGPEDEVGELAGTFDHMLDHLDKVFKSQKDFVADASHDLRTPLTVIQGNLDLLKRDLSEKDREESLDTIRQETGRMRNILNDLLLLAEIDSDREEPKESVSLEQIVEGAADLARQLGPDHQIIELLPENIVVKGNQHRLEVLMSNLITNAVKYTPKGSTITISAFRKGEWACLEVRDTGEGIPPDHLPHLFDRFYRADKTRSESRGTGLGLAIVKGIAEQHGGKVSAESVEGEGATFTVWLKL